MIAKLDTLKAGNKKPKRSPAQIKTLQTWAKKNGVSVARMKPYLYGNRAGTEPSEVMKILMNKLKIGDELNSSGIRGGSNVSDRD